MKGDQYVLITPARNEQGAIGETLRSVLSQTQLPAEWIIVDDGSTDQTGALVKSFLSHAPFLRLLRRDTNGPRDFASVVHATEFGYSALQTRDYAFVGLLDADVRFQKDYFEKLIAGFDSEPQLGISGGLVLDCDDPSGGRTFQNLSAVAGAVQFFRRNCFESLGGLLAIPEGGWDAITCVRARMNGFRTATRPDLIVEHLKNRNAAYGNAFQRHSQLGLRDYVLGAHPLVETLKCIRRIQEHPAVIAGSSRMIGYLRALFTRRKRHVPAEIMEFARAEQMRRVFQPILRFGQDRNLAISKDVAKPTKKDVSALN